MAIGGFLVMLNISTGRELQAQVAVIHRTEEVICNASKANKTHKNAKKGFKPNILNVVYEGKHFTKNRNFYMPKILAVSSSQYIVM